MKIIGRYIAILSLAAFLLSCNGYNKLLKSSNYELKLERASEFYKKGNYIKALELYGELIPIYKGSDKAEEIYYYYTYCNYYQGDYSLSQYHFKNFVRQFPNSSHTEECHFMNAYCYYLTSPNYKLDQTETKAAMREFQSFVDDYPDSKRVDSCNLLMDNLRRKLEMKEYDIIKQYYKLSDYLRDYKAVITSVKNFAKEFPDSGYLEEVRYLVIDSYYKMASNSVPGKKMQRLDEAIESYLKFVDLYPKSQYLGSAEAIYNSCVQTKETLKKREQNGF